MKETDENSFLNNKQYTNEDNNFLNNTLDDRMETMLENSQSIIKKIKAMSKEINSDLQSQNKFINELGMTLSRTNSQLKKNNSKLDEFLNRTSTCSLIGLTIIQVIAVIVLILIL